MTNKNSDFIKSLTSNPKPGIGPTPAPPAITPTPARVYSDNAKYDFQDGPPAPLLQDGETDF